MTNYELIKLNQGLITFLASEDISAKDVEYLPLYEEYQDMKSQGLKISWIASELARKYKCTERNVYKVIKRLSKHH